MILVRLIESMSDKLADDLGMGLDQDDDRFVIRDVLTTLTLFRFSTVILMLACF
jgi:hypothetical protein